MFGKGAVQEEILFCLYPEFSVSRLFCERLLAHECLLMGGGERFCVYEGYSKTFRFAGTGPPAAAASCSLFAACCLLGGNRCRVPNGRRVSRP